MSLRTAQTVQERRILNRTRARAGDVFRSLPDSIGGNIVFVYRLRMSGNISNNTPCFSKVNKIHRRGHVDAINRRRYVSRRLVSFKTTPHPPVNITVVWDGAPFISAPLNTSPSVPAVSRTSQCRGSREYERCKQSVLRRMSNQ